MVKSGQVIFRTATAHLVFVVNLDDDLAELQDLINKTIPSAANTALDLANFHCDRNPENIKKIRNFDPKACPTELAHFQFLARTRQHGLMIAMRDNLQDQLNRVISTLESINSQSMLNYGTRRRAKRQVGLFAGILGGVAGIAFGIYNTLSIEQLRHKIDNIAEDSRHNTIRMLQLDTTIKRNSIAIRDMLHVQKKYIREMENLQDMVTLNSRSQVLFAMLSHLTSKTTSLVNSLSHILNHQFPLGLIDPATVHHQFKLLKQTAAFAQKRPVIDNPLSLYQSKLDFFSRGRQMLLVLDVPLTSTDTLSPYHHSFDLYVPNPDLIRLNTTIWLFDTDEILLKARTSVNIFATTTDRKISKCQDYGDLRICPILPIDNNPSCTANILTNHTLEPCQQYLTAVDPDLPAYQIHGKHELTYYAPHQMAGVYRCTRSDGSRTTTSFAVKDLTSIQLTNRCEIHLNQMTFASDQDFEQEVEVTPFRTPHLTPENFKISTNELHSKLDAIINDTSAIEDYNSITLKRINNFQHQDKSRTDRFFNHPVTKYGQTSAAIIVFFVTVVSIAIAALLSMKFCRARTAMVYSVFARSRQEKQKRRQRHQLYKKALEDDLIARLHRPRPLPIEDTPSPTSEPELTQIMQQKNGQATPNWIQVQVPLHNTTPNSPAIIQHPLPPPPAHASA